MCVYTRDECAQSRCDLAYSVHFNAHASGARIKHKLFISKDCCSSYDNVFSAEKITSEITSAHHKSTQPRKRGPHSAKTRACLSASWDFRLVPVSARGAPSDDTSSELKRGSLGYAFRI